MPGPPPPASFGGASAVPRPHGAPFEIYDVPISGGTEEHSAMVVQPVAPMIIDRAHLARSGQSTSLSPVELWMCSEAQRRGRGGRVLLFRGLLENGHPGWEFDSEFSDRCQPTFGSSSAACSASRSC